MKEITLKIPDDRLNFFIELIKSLDFINTYDSNKEAIENIKQGFKELKLYKQGKLETTLAEDFLNEL